MILSLQVLRAFCFCGVFLSHCKIFVFNSAGSWAVSVFFVMSGFLLSVRHGTESFRRGGAFVWQHIRKVYLLHFLMTIVAGCWIVFFAYPINLKTIADLLIQLLLNMTLMQSWVPIGRYYFSFNWVSWFLSSLMFCYFMYPLIARQVCTIRTFNGFALSFAFVVLTMVVATLVGSQLLPQLMARFTLLRHYAGNTNLAHWYTYVCPAYRIGDFVCGCLLGQMFQISHVRFTHVLDRLSVGLLAVMGVFALWQVNNIFSSGIFEWIKYDLFWLPFSCILVYLVAMIEVKENNVMFVLLWLGKVSGYAYLMHRMILLFTTIVFGYDEITAKSAPIWDKVMISIVAFCLTSIFSWIVLAIKRRNVACHLSR